MTMIFQTVHKRDQFMQLLAISDAPDMQSLPILEQNPASVCIDDKSPDLNILTITWNMGASESKDLLTNMDAFFKDRLKGVDLIIMASQECRMKFKTQRILTLE